MALPTTLNPSRPAGNDAVNDPASSIDNQIRDLKQFIADWLGTPVDPTSLTAAPFSITAAGVVSLVQPTSHRLLGRPLVAVTTNVTFTDSTAENTLLSVSLPGGFLGTTGSIVVTWFGRVTDTTSMTYRLKYGGTTIATAVLASTTDVAIMGHAIISSDGATNDQDGCIMVTASGIVPAGGTGTAAVDSTVSQTLALTSQGATATDDSSLLHALFEYIP